MREILGFFQNYLYKEKKIWIFTVENANINFCPLNFWVFFFLYINIFFETQKMPKIRVQELVFI